MSVVAFGKDLIIATKQVCKHQEIQFVLACGFGLLDFSFHLQEQLFHLACPRLLEFFFE
jgi:hypothetical protein